MIFFCMEINKEFENHLKKMFIEIHKIPFIINKSITFFGCIKINISKPPKNYPQSSLLNWII